MSDSDPSGPVPESPPTPEMRQWAGLPWVWTVPVVAAIIAGWLGYRALIERGPTITISFPTADGIEADRTTIRYKNVELGRVTGIGLTSDRSVEKNFVSLRSVCTSGGRARSGNQRS